MAKENEAPKIDLSKIKNMEAVKAQDPEFATVIKKTFKPKGGKSKFNFTQPERIPLPSKGRFYGSVTDDEDVLNGYIFMYPMTATEEDILVNGRFLKSGVATRMILDNCIASGIDAKDLLVFDSNFLLFYLRQISYGDEYKFGIKCPACRKQFTHKVEISKLAFEELPKELEEPIEVKLPVSKYTVNLLLPRVYHSEIIYQKRAEIQDEEELDKGLKLLSTVMATTISIQTDRGEEVPKKDWEDFFGAIPGMDRAILSERTTFTTGIDDIKGLDCPFCDEKFNTTVPMGIEFFRL